jgi:hypothetical protein
MNNPVVFPMCLRPQFMKLCEFLLTFSEEVCQRSKMAYRSFARRERESSLRKIHGTTSSHFADS